MATFPAPATSNAACGCRDRNAARATVGGEFPTCTLSVVQRVPSSTMVHGSASPPTIPDGRLSRVRFWPRLCTPFFSDSPSCPMGGLSRSLTYAPPRYSFAVPSSQLSRGRIPSSVSGVLWRSSGPPSAQSPFAWDGRYPPTRVTQRSPQRALPLFPSSYGLMRQTTVLPTPRWSLGGGVCAGCRESLLDHGPSRHYLCHLCGGAWTHTPPCSSGAHTHFFPNDSGLTSRETRSAHGKIPARRFPQGAHFRGCNHSLIFRLPHLLGLQIAPTAVHRLGGQAVYTTHRPRGYPPRDVVSLHVCMGI